jgi:hypothetical protein
LLIAINIAMSLISAVGYYSVSLMKLKYRVP